MSWVRVCRFDCVWVSVREWSNQKESSKVFTIIVSNSNLYFLHRIYHWLHHMFDLRHTHTACTHGICLLLNRRGEQLKYIFSLDFAWFGRRRKKSAQRYIIECRNYYYFRWLRAQSTRHRLPSTDIHNFVIVLGRDWLFVRNFQFSRVKYELLRIYLLFNSVECRESERNKKDHR